MLVSLVYHQKNIAVRGTCCGKTASQFADLLTNMLRTYHRKTWMVCYVAMCLLTVFLFQNCLLTHTNASSRNPPKKHQKVFVPKAHFITMTSKRSSVSQTHIQQKGYHFMASSHFLGLFFKLLKRHSFHMPKVINPPWVGRPRIRRFLLSLG